MSIIGNPIMAGVSGPAASIFVTGLAQTDTVTATNGSKTKVGVWTQIPNPAYVVPDGYTQLEYIESTGTQYIQTGISAPNGFRISCEIMNNLGAYSTICAARPTNVNVDNNGLYWEGSSQIGVGAGGWATGGSRVTNKKYQVDASTIVGNLFFKLDDVSQSFSFNPSYPQTNQRSGNLLTLFATINMEGEVKGFAQDTLYAAKIYTSIDDSELVGDFIPCKRTSDNAIGLYDLVSNSFFENAGTGTFTAGAEVPQTIDGFLIKPIREFGTWTVTATDGIQTETKDVLVDVITEYEIEMLCSKQYLYLNGDECEDITGGWEGIIYNGNHSYTIDPKNGCMYLYSSSGSGNVRVFPSNKISTSGFSTLNFDIQPKTNASNAGIYLGWSSQNTDWSIDSNVNIPANSNPGRVVKSLDISDLDAEYYLKIVVSGGECYVYGVWLEKEVNS